MSLHRIELHMHSVLSPCASLEMIPPLIIEKALEEKIDIIALTDHNTAANVPAMLDAAVGTGITVFPGMELETSEEIHVLCLFDTWHNCKRLRKLSTAIFLTIKTMMNFSVTNWSWTKMAISSVRKNAYSTPHPPSRFSKHRSRSKGWEDYSFLLMWKGKRMACSPAWVVCRQSFTYPL